MDGHWFNQKQMHVLRHYVLLVMMPVFFLSTGLRTNSASVVGMKAVRRLHGRVSSNLKLIGVGKGCRMNPRKVGYIDKPLDLAAREPGDFESRAEDLLKIRIIPVGHRRQVGRYPGRCQTDPDKSYRSTAVGRCVISACPESVAWVQTGYGCSAYSSTA
jgi:hypothetical protein